MSFVTAVTVTHNGSRVLEGMLTTLPQEIPLIVVDNASQDNSVDIVERIRSDAKIFKNEIGLGYGNGMNVGLPHVQTEYVLMVNPDTVLNAEAIDAMIAVAEENPQAGLLAPVTYNPDGSIETSHDVVLEKRSLCPSRDGEPVPEGPICADYLSGAVVMGRMSALREIGFFDPEFFLYYEDDDMCRRLKDAVTGLLKFGALPDREGEPETLVADVHRLMHEVSFQPKYSLADGLADMIASLR